MQQVAREDERQTLHLFVVPEENLPPQPDYIGTAITIVCSLMLMGIVGLLLFSPKAEPTVSFLTTIPGFRLAPVSQEMTITIHATGKGHMAATYATGTITFYNGQTYTQLFQ